MPQHSAHSALFPHNSCCVELGCSCPYGCFSIYFVLNDHAIDTETANVMDSERRALYHNRSAIEMSFNMVARIDNATDLAGMRSAGKSGGSTRHDWSVCTARRYNGLLEPALPRLHRR